MQIAYTAKSNSGCISRQVGAVVTEEDHSVKAVGWNDVAKGQVPCALRSLDGLIQDFDTIAYSKYERQNSEFRFSANKKLIKLSNISELNGKIYLTVSKILKIIWRVAINHVEIRYTLGRFMQRKMHFYNWQNMVDLESLVGNYMQLLVLASYVQKKRISWALRK